MKNYLSSKDIATWQLHLTGSDDPSGYERKHPALVCSTVRQQPEESTQLMSYQCSYYLQIYPSWKGWSGRYLCKRGWFSSPWALWVWNNLSGILWMWNPLMRFLLFLHYTHIVSARWGPLVGQGRPRAGIVRGNHQAGWHTGPRLKFSFLGNQFRDQGSLLRAAKGTAPYTPCLQ